MAGERRNPLPSLAVDATAWLEGGSDGFYPGGQGSSADPEPPATQCRGTPVTDLLRMPGNLEPGLGFYGRYDSFFHLIMRQAPNARNLAFAASVNAVYIDFRASTAKPLLECHG